MLVFHQDMEIRNIKLIFQLTRKIQCFMHCYEIYGTSSRKHYTTDILKKTYFIEKAQLSVNLGEKSR